MFTVRRHQRPINSITIFKRLWSIQSSAWITDSQDCTAVLKFDSPCYFSTPSPSCEFPCFASSLVDSVHAPDFQDVRFNAHGHYADAASLDASHQNCIAVTSADSLCKVRTKSEESRLRCPNCEELFAKFTINLFQNVIGSSDMSDICVTSSEQNAT